MEIVISISEAELEEFPQEAPESSEQSSETSHTPGTVKTLSSIDTSPTPELLDKIQWGKVTYLIGNTPTGESDSRSQTYRVSKQPTPNCYSRQPRSLAIHKPVKAHKRPRCLHKLGINQPHVNQQS